MKQLLVCVAVLMFTGIAQSEPTVLDVWPGKPPGDPRNTGAETSKEERKGVTILHNVSQPKLAIYRPDKEKDTGAAIVICPGGGYSILAIEHEGNAVARWLNSIGVTAAVLKYRVPGQRAGALMDAQRALSLVRSKAKEWNLDAKRIGVLGFSAGGHLAAAAATNFGKRSYETQDAVDESSCRPDFAVLIYPAYLIGDDGKLANDLHVSKETPQMFFAHSTDDPISPENSIVLYQALRRARVPVEMHLYASGGHGYGILPGDQPYQAWPQRCADWMRSRGLLNK